MRSRALRFLLRERAGAAAVEFALIAPTMVIMFLGTIEITNVIRVQAKLNVTAGQLVELIAGQAQVTEGTSRGPGGTLGDMCTGAALNMLPYNPAYVSANIGSDSIGSGGNQYVVWVDAQSCAQTYNAGGFYGTPALEALMNSPRSLFKTDGVNGNKVPGYSAVAVTMSYQYQNVIPFILGSSITLTATAESRPRSNATITCTIGATTTACPGS